MGRRDARAGASGGRALRRRGRQGWPPGSASSRPTTPVRRAFCPGQPSVRPLAPSIRHTRWRPFQLGFVLANLASIVDRSPDGERHVVDTLWFATGGGKTETYLLYVLTAAFHDRLRGKTEGITSWGRFPLRMLSLQQTQRFADVLVAADLVRRDEQIRGAVLPRLHGRQQRHAQPDPDATPRARTRLPGPGHASSLPGPAALPVLRVRRAHDALRPDSMGSRSPV